MVSASERDKPEAALKESLSALLFIEMLFWKNANDSGEVRDEYRWRVSIYPSSYLTEEEQNFWYTCSMCLCS